ncbi:hypothetical protein PTT_10300 [Pyrenophora teres f. teres 0-1]|uniref:Uncharacterized protein n=1 Tax=Pyrenophora teres f. teres (strain 0-1) TaxID=861557 RepID=E3RNX8_PYRTT|nr:hypothetical protein PTT_10300 [Pyrenophora teres f. teres 0-1]
MVDVRVERGTFEYGDGQYCNKYFLVPKIERLVKPEDFWFINNAVRYNAVTLRDAYIPLSADEFLERFANRRTRDMIAFQTLNGLY